MRPLIRPLIHPIFPSSSCFAPRRVPSSLQKLYLALAMPFGARQSLKLDIFGHCTGLKKLVLFVSRSTLGAAEEEEEGPAAQTDSFSFALEETLTRCTALTSLKVHARCALVDLTQLWLPSLTGLTSLRRLRTEGMKQVHVGGYGARYPDHFVMKGLVDRQFGE